VNSGQYILDTHAFFFWITQKEISLPFIQFLDKMSLENNLLVSTVSIWELALLNRKKRILIPDLQQWIQEIREYSPVRFTSPDTKDMIDSVNLPDYHHDPFDRILIAQAVNLNAFLVTKDQAMGKYPLKTFWM
jgi:PIN domain nuclease of toxin-antitoxin system